MTAGASAIAATAGGSLLPLAILLPALGVLLSLLIGAAARLGAAETAGHEESLSGVTRVFAAVLCVLVALALAAKATTIPVITIACGTGSACNPAAAPFRATMPNTRKTPLPIRLNARILRSG